MENSITYVAMDTHKKQHRVALVYPNDEQIIEFSVKNLDERAWSLFLHCVTTVQLASGCNKMVPPAQRGSHHLGVQQLPRNGYLPSQFYACFAAPCLK